MRRAAPICLLLLLLLLLGLLCCSGGGRLGTPTRDAVVGVRVHSGIDHVGGSEDQAIFGPLLDAVLAADVLSESECSAMLFDGVDDSMRAGTYAVGGSEARAGFRLDDGTLYWVEVWPPGTVSEWFAVYVPSESVFLQPRDVVAAFDNLYAQVSKP